jgi:hypothetical protein
MRIKTAELLAPTAEGFRTIVRMAYAAGRARGREEAKRQLRGLAEPPASSATSAGNSNDVLGDSLEHFQAKWTPVRVKKMRSNKDLERFSDAMGSENALDEVHPPETKLSEAAHHWIAATVGPNEQILA